MLTTEVQDAAVTKLDGEADGVAEGVVTDDDGLVDSRVGGVAHRGGRGAISQLEGLGRFDKTTSTSGPDSSEHEVAGGGIPG